MKSKRPNPPCLDIGVDIDGVLYPFVSSLRRYVTTHLGRPASELPEPLEWNFEVAWGMANGQLVQAMHDGIDHGDLLLDQDPYPGVREGLYALRAAGHRVHLVTDRAWMGRTPGEAKSRTATWLSVSGIAYDTLTFAKDKTATPMDIFIEDRPENYQALAAAGVDTFLRAHPYNAHIPTPTDRRVANFAEFTERVLNLAA